MKMRLVAVILGGAMLSLAGCYVEGAYGGPAVIAVPRVVIETPGIIIDEPGIFIEPGIVFRAPIVIWDFELRREIVIDRHEWEHWRTDREGRHIDPRGRHFEFRRDARWHRHEEERHR